MPTNDELLGQVRVLARELLQRASMSRTLNSYYDGNCPFPTAVVRARMTSAYRTLMPMSEAAWASLVVDSVQDRLEVTGIRSDDDAADEAVWSVWQDNAMDAESKLGHNSALIDGRAFATVWPGPDGRPEIVLDSAEQMIVQYREGSRRQRTAALRMWDEGGETLATLYRPDGIYKFRARKTLDPRDVKWERRDVTGESWPLRNPLGVVPVVEIAVNRRLKPGSFGFARGEFQHCLGLIDRINLLTFLGLVVAMWMGFPLRGVIGDRIIRDDSGNAVAPFNADADSVFQLENPDAKLAEYSAADRRNLSVYAELDQLAVITKSPRHYFPLEQGMSNLSADAIRASEGGLHAKVTGHKASLGEGWEEVLRLAGRMLPEPVVLPPHASLLWADHESRSLAERADAAIKLQQSGLPWPAVAEIALKLSQDSIRRFESEQAGSALTALIQAAEQPALSPMSGNGDPPMMGRA